MRQSTMCVRLLTLRRKRLLQQTAFAAPSPAPGTQKEDAAAAEMGLQACVHTPVNEHVWAVTQAAIAAAGRGGAKVKKAATGPSPAAGGAQKEDAAAPAPPVSGKEPANFPGTVVASPVTPQTAAANSIPAVFPGGTSTSVSRSRCF